jgi:phage terminase large subunit-like protein
MSSLSSCGRPQRAAADGASRLARHVGNAILREDSRGPRLSKEHKDSPRRIDAAVAAVLAVHRAAELAGAREPSIYL